MAHISRKDLKKDEVRDTVQHGWEALMSHQELTTGLLIAIIVVALGVLGYRLYSERQDVKASAAYDAAMTSFNARVLTAGAAPAESGEVTFSDNQSKYTDAAAKFAAVASKYPHTHYGMFALYYGGISYERSEHVREARNMFQALTRSSDADLASLGSYSLAQSDERSGMNGDAVKLYQQLIDKPTTLVPKPVAMLALAEHYAATNPLEAQKLFNQIKADYAGTPIADQADDGLALLQASKKS